VPTAPIGLEQQLGIRTGIASGVVEQTIAYHQQRRLMPVDRMLPDQRAKRIAHPLARIKPECRRRHSAWLTMSLREVASPAGLRSRRTAAVAPNG
jgi:hypothetical protein